MLTDDVIQRGRSIYRCGGAPRSQLTYAEKLAMLKGSTFSMRSRMVASESTVDNSKHAHIFNAWAAGEGGRSRSNSPPADPKKDATLSDIIHKLTTRPVSAAAILEKTPSAHTGKTTQKADPASRNVLDERKEERGHSSPDVQREQYDDNATLALVEWQMIAMVTDRVMLVVFTALVVGANAAVFSNIPE